MNISEYKRLYNKKILKFWFSQFWNSAMILKHQNIHWNGFDLFLTMKENLSRTGFHDCNFKQKYIYWKKDKEIKWTDKMKHPVFYKNENFFLANKFLVCFLACVKKKTTTGEEGKEDNERNLQ